jgi:hypothetical protein
MEKKKTKRSLIAKKAWETRKKKNEHVKSQEAGIKAQEKTRKPVEYGYIDELSNVTKISKNRIFHHEGIPDIMLITKEGKLRFYEIKPKKGAIDRKLLNPRQLETIKKLLKNDRVEEVSLVKYEKQKGKPIYDPPIKLTRSNIRKYSYV